MGLSTRRAGEEAMTTRKNSKQIVRQRRHTTGHQAHDHHGLSQTIPVLNLRKADGTTTFSHPPRQLYMQPNHESPAGPNLPTTRHSRSRRPRGHHHLAAPGLRLRVTMVKKSRE